MSYVVAGYTVTIVAIGGYALWVTSQLRAARGRAGATAGRAVHGAADSRSAGRR